jgi:MFS family permease
LIYQQKNRGDQFMAAVDAASDSGGPSNLGWLAKERTIAAPDYNRWLVPPAALAIHLCIGMAYGFSVFWLPLSRSIGISQSVSCGKVDGFFDELLQQLMASNCDWKISSLGWMFTLFFVFLGSAAAIWGGWLEHAGPRKAGVVAALCWCGGLVISALGVATHQIWLMWVGSGVIGGIGLGLGYISPVSTLIKWFPDRRGMATGMAIMGFGGGAMIGAPLADTLMRYFATPTSVGVWETFLTMAVIYFVYMMGGALGYRLPAPGWRPSGWTPASTTNVMITNEHVHLNQSMHTPQFWLIWGILTLNVSAGIGIIGMASPLLQEVFGGHLIGVDAGFTDLNADQKKQIATLAAGFTGLLSLFNIAGRIFWASLSDKIGRKATYFVFFVLGMILYSSIPTLAHGLHLALFVLAFCIILSMYGGGFATVPAYLADMFGTQMVGAIHGRLLTAWSTAGVLGPVLVNYIREYQIGQGLPRAQVYDNTMYILAGLLLLGFICNLLVRPVAARWFMTPEQLAFERQLAHDRSQETSLASDIAASSEGSGMALILAWAAVGIPLAWGVWVTVRKAIVLFG